MEAIIGSEEMARGTLTRAQLRARYAGIFPDVYLPRDVERTVLNMAYGGWLWSGRSGVICGRSAAALLGVSWVDIHAPIELLCAKRSSSPGLLVRRERYAEDEVRQLDCGLLVTTPARTALDLGRHWPRDVAVTHLDALSAATGVSPIEVMNLAHRYRGAARITDSRWALRLMDAGARAPRDTALRLALVDAGFPRPATQIEVWEGMEVTTVALGWERYRIALTYAEYDGYRGHPWHELDRNNFLQLQGWINLYVSESHSLRMTVRRVRQAFSLQRRRGL